MGNTILICQKKKYLLGSKVEFTDYEVVYIFYYIRFKNIQVLNFKKI